MGKKSIHYYHFYTTLILDYILRKKTENLEWDWTHNLPYQWTF